MRTKKMFRKKEIDNVDKENLVIQNVVEKKKPQSMMDAQKSSKCMNNLTAVIEQPPTEETTIGFSTEKASDNVLTEQTIIDFSTENTPDDVGTEDTILDFSAPKASDDRSVTNDNASRGKKRSLEDGPDLHENKKSSNSYNESFEIKISKLEKKCADLEAKLKVYEEGYMPRPQDPNVIRYLIDFGNTLSGVPRKESVSDNGSLVEVLEVIGINANELAKFSKKTATATARALIKKKYPNPDPEEGFSQVDKSIVEAIIKYVKHSHPHDTTSDTELRRAMTNYFSVLTFKAKSMQ